MPGGKSWKRKHYIKVYSASPIIKKIPSQTTRCYFPPINLAIFLRSDNVAKPELSYAIENDYFVQPLQRAILQYFEKLEEYTFFHEAVPTFRVNLRNSTFRENNGILYNSKITITTKQNLVLYLSIHINQIQFDYNNTTQQKYCQMILQCNMVRKIEKYAKRCYVLFLDRKIHSNIFKTQYSFCDNFVMVM